MGAEAFLQESVAALYRHRPDYPDEVFDRLDALLADRPRTVLDIGCGEGSVARPLAPRVDHVDAVDISAAMIAMAPTRPGGDAANITWLLGAMEDVELAGPYALVTAGASLHWMDLARTVPRLRSVMAPGAVIAIVDRSYVAPWWQEILPTIVEHSTDPSQAATKDFRSRLEQHVEILREDSTTPVLLHPSVDDYIAQLHSTATLANAPAAFDDAIRSVVDRHADGEGVLALDVTATITTCRPR